MNAVITVLGKDNVGILANISNKCAEAGANIIEVTQSVCYDYVCRYNRMYSTVCSTC